MPVPPFKGDRAARCFARSSGRERVGFFSGVAAWSPSAQTPKIHGFVQSKTMNVLRFSDLCAQGRATGQRVFIRADLNVPQDDAGHITEETRIRASVPCIRMALDAGAAVMATSHLGRPTE